MMKRVMLAALAAVAPLGASFADTAVRTGQAAFGDFSADAPGVWRHITVADLPQPYATSSGRGFAREQGKPQDLQLKTLPGFSVSLFATGLRGPRRMRMAPNGDIFLAESNGGRVTVLRAKPGADKVEQTSVFAEGLSQPYGIAFYPEKDP